MPPPLEVPPDVASLLTANAPVAIGVSGGKDSVACALAVAAYLRLISHTGPKVLVHADLGVVEWADSGPSCERASEFLQGRHFVPRGPEPHTRNWSLHVTRRGAGGMMERWESRWAACVHRYRELECVKLILPWSTPSMRFCSGELKRDPICAYLKRLFGKVPIVSVTGIRADESAQRSKMPASKVNEKLPCGSLDWNPIIRWNVDQVFEEIRLSGLRLHEAYSLFGSSRVSCVFCIMSSASDLRAALKDPRNLGVYRRMCRLEAVSGFAFQAGKWLMDVAPEMLEVNWQLSRVAKELCAAREAAEARIPKDLLYTKGWPTRLPTTAEAAIIASVRREVSTIQDIRGCKYLTITDVIERYRELMALKHAKEAAIQAKAARKASRAEKKAGA